MATGSDYDQHAEKTLTQEKKERIRRLYEQEAPIYDRTMRVAERILLGGAREWVCHRARGDVLEIAVGTGRNLPCYTADIRLTGIDLSPAMLDITKQRAAGLGREVDLRLGDAEQLEFADESFDAVVCTYSLCTIPNDAQAVREMHRVLRPGGKLLLAQHVRSPMNGVRACQWALEPLAVRFSADHLLREPLELVRAQGLTSTSLDGGSWVSSNSWPHPGLPKAPSRGCVAPVSCTPI